MSEYTVSEIRKVRVFNRSLTSVEIQEQMLEKVNPYFDSLIWESQQERMGE